MYAADLGSQINTLTVKEETIDDALAAVALLRRTPGIDPRKIFVLGHSLGGTLAPRIGLRDSGIRGFIVMAGAARPLEDVVLDQTRYILSLDGSLSAEQKQKDLAKVEQQVARVKDPGLSDATPASELPLGIPAAYWLDLRGYDPPKVAKSLNRPFLILQGERDYQVTMVDFVLWRESLAKYGSATFKSYSDLNHLFIAGVGKSTPAEYELPGHVSGQVVSDIARWIKAEGN